MPPAEGETSALEAEGGGGIALTLVQRDEGDAVRLARDVEGGGEVAQVRASEARGEPARARRKEARNVERRAARAQRPAAAAASASQRSRLAGGRTIRNRIDPSAATRASTMNPVR